MILNLIYFFLIIFILLISSIVFNKLFSTKKNKYKTLSILFLTDFNKNIFDSSKKWGQALYYNYVLSQFLSKTYTSINFNIYIKVLNNNTNINILKRFIYKNNIKIIIPTEANNAFLLSKYKDYFYSIKTYFMENYEYYKILDDKYSLKYLCKKYCIHYPKTISVSDRSICEVIRFIKKYNGLVFLKKKNNTLGGYGVYDLSNSNINNNDIYPKINSDEWIIQKKINGVFIGVDVLYIYGDIQAITFHKNKNYKKMFKGFDKYYFPSWGESCSHFGLKMTEYFYINDFLEIIRKIGKITKYNGLMNIDFLYKIINRKIKIYLLEINPRIGGSIHISAHTGLLKSYFDYLIYNRQNEKIIKFRNSDIEKWSNHQYTSLIPYVLENMDVILNINNLENNSRLEIK
jgi:predicted ATP-grasp superfamily ATP-dependent carboligase